MQVVLWFAGLRGAIAFAFSQNMPGPNQDLYVTTTLSVCIFTTIICGGMTEPLLTYTQLKRDQPHQSGGSEETDDEEQGLLNETISDHDGDEDADVRNHPVFARQEEKSVLHSFWSNIDERYMKPVFGGSVHRRVKHQNPDVLVGGLTQLDQQGELLPPLNHTWFLGRACCS
ncbi:hypothetical protein ON010_g11258 [Phytophthora cinnamomi]|nr:hypothetical protein ON010_g11258 [Phytophthora cinnamomi]